MSAADLCCAHAILVRAVQLCMPVDVQLVWSLCCSSRKVLHMSRGSVASAYLGIGRSAIAGCTLVFAAHWCLHALDDMVFILVQVG